MTSKLDCMQENPKLFQDFQKQVGRAKHLYAAVYLCESSIMLILFKLDQTGVENITTFRGYSRESYMTLESMLDNRARAMKNTWLAEFQKLADSEMESVFEIDLTNLDYALLKVGTPNVVQHYLSKWCFKDLVGMAQFISDHSNPYFNED